MDFYLSGSYNKEEPILDYVAESQCPVLASFAYPAIVEFRLQAIADRLRGTGKTVKFMLDSGAFTAWSNGAVIDREELLNQMKACQDKYSDVFKFSFVSLDKIPGDKGRPVSDADRETACHVSAENYIYLHEAMGDFVKPVYHTGDPDWLLDLYKDAPTIGLGMNLQWAESSRVLWAHETGKRLAHKNLHGLAATGWSMLRATKWHSVDSASWMYTASMGCLSWLRADGKLSSIAVSTISPKLKEIDMHIDTMPEVYREELRSKMAAVGLDLEQAKESGAIRQVWNAIQAREACDMAAKEKAYDKPKQKGLF